MEQASFITARQRIGSMVVSLLVICLAGLLTFLWVMHLNVGMSSPSYFVAFLQTPYFYYSKVHVMGFLQHFELEGPSNCEINCWVSRWRVFESSCSIHRSQRSSPKKWFVCLSDIMCVWCYWNMDNFKFNFLLQGQLWSLVSIISSYLYSKYYHSMRFSLVTLFLSLLLDCSAEIISIFFLQVSSQQQQNITNGVFSKP